MLAKVDLFDYYSYISSANQPENKMFAVNQIVKGKVAGTFVILGFFKSAGEELVQLKTVNPNNHAQFGRGELALPIDAIRAI